MTMTAAPPKAAHQKEQLAAGELRRGLTALLRRRLPAQDVEDVAQTVLCDALAAGRVPADPEELRRWLSGIARHKVADFHRRAARRKARDGGGLEVLPAAASTTPAAFEEREALEGVLGSVQTRRDVETLEWLVREHGGERLADIASENRLPAPVVRQRVSRLRRALRSRWAGLVGGVGGALVVLLVAAVAANDARAPTAVIVREPVAPPSALPASPVAIPNDLRGDWIVQSVTPNRALTPVEASALDLQTKHGTTSVRLGEDAIALDLGPSATRRAWQVVRARTGADGRVRLDLVGDDFTPDVAVVGFARDAYGARLDVTFRGASVTLRRPVL